MWDRAEHGSDASKQSAILMKSSLKLREFNDTMYVENSTVVCCRETDKQIDKRKLPSARAVRPVQNYVGRNKLHFEK